MKVAVLGTGLLGAGFVQGFRKKGAEVTVWNRTAARAEALRPHGVEVAGSPEEAVRGAERVHLVLSDDAAVDAVMERIGPGVGVTVVDHTTVSPAGVVARVARWGEAYLHAPVFMGPKNAADATGIMMVSGPAALVERHVAALEAMTGKLVRLGERPDLAAVYKLCGNGMLLSVLAATSDVIDVARGAGVDPSQMLSLFGWFDVAPVITFRGSKIAKGQYGPATFELAMARKDLRLMLETASADHPIVLPAVAARMDALIAEGLGHEDYAIIGRPRG